MKRALLSLSGMLALTLGFALTACEGDQGKSTMTDSTTVPADQGQHSVAQPVSSPVDTGGAAPAGQSKTDGDIAAKSFRNILPETTSVTPHSGWITWAQVWYYEPQWGGWHTSGCFQLPAPGQGMWVPNGDIPNDVDVFFDGFSSADHCYGGRKDFQYRDHSPADRYVYPDGRAYWYVDVY